MGEAIDLLGKISSIVKTLFNYLVVVKNKFWFYICSVH